ncbi:MAG TPA: PAC2 family protein [Solirubrobacterales bacterium]|nr:PAC2 family protein [Solirubrobacterales bacterium]
MDPLIWEGEPPSLRSPILIAAFAGWNDAASAATTALDAIVQSLDAEVFATIDPEEFYDFQVNRPTVRLVDAISREIDWPEGAFLSGRPAAGDHDLVLLNGIEPNLRWRTYSGAILDVAERLGVEMVVTMGALLADVAHTRPVPITGLASDERMVERLGLSRSSYEGPTGIVGVIHDACRNRGIESASIWAAVPHYVAAVPNPKAALALLERLDAFTGISVDVTDLEQSIETFDRQVDAAVAANSEIEELVRRLETEQDEALESESDVPSGDSIARDFQRFLRQQDE